MKKLNKWLFRSGKKVINSLPSQIKKPIIRRLVRLQPEMPSGLSVRPVQTIEEALAAFRIVNQSYKEQGYIPQNERKIQLNKYQLLPGSVIVVAIHNGEVVGTLTLVKSSGFGLPCQRAFELPESLIRPNVAEVTCLAIKKEFRRERGTDALFPLMRYMYFFCLKHWGVSQICATCLPRDFNFYHVFFGFNTVPGCETVNSYLGAPAMALHLDLGTVYHHLKKDFSRLPRKYNLFNYLYHSPMTGFSFPDGPNTESAFRNAELVTELFKNYSEIIEYPELSLKEAELFKLYYPTLGLATGPSNHLNAVHPEPHHR